jgi:1-acyl-sn-glycerol-3-phosphate acyltransferase
MRKLVAFLSLIFTTLVFCIAAIIASFLDRNGDKAHWASRTWGRVHLKACGIRVLVAGLENLSQPPYIFMANHQSALDIPALLVALPLSLRWVAKRELFRIPIFGWAIRRAGYISLDREHAREAVKAMEEAAAKIRNGASVALFPEGTRSPTGALLPFKKGSFSLLFKSGVPVVPVGIWGSGALQPPGKLVPFREGTIWVRFGAPITVAGRGRPEREHVIDSVRTTMERLVEESQHREK